MDDFASTLFTVDEASDLPIWVQLRNRIEFLIRTGKFAPGEQLPSVRTISATAQINFSTVTKAFRDLELNGYIEAVRGRGMYVKGVPNAGDGSLDAIDAQLESCIRQYRDEGITYEEIRERICSVIDGAVHKNTPNR